MKETRRVALLIIIMAAVSLFVGIISSTILYRSAFEEQRQRLSEIATSQALHIKEVIRFEMAIDEDHLKDVDVTDLKNILEHHIHFSPLKNTGEIVIARRESDLMEFLVRKKEHAAEAPAYLSFDSTLAEPMRRALSGLSGTTIALDYRGEKVLAAYRPIEDLDLGVVAKIDLKEVSAPFIRAGLISAIFGFIFILLGAFLFTRVTNPMIRHIEESENKYRELVSNANSVIIRWKNDGTITFFNEYAQSFFGYSAGEVIGKHVGILVPGRDSTGADLSTLIQDIVSNPDLYVNNINENICRDGRKVWMVWTNKPIFDDRGQVTEILAVGSDITAQKQAENALRESEERYRMLIHSMNDGFRVLDENGRFTFVNDKFIEMFGYSKNEVIGKKAIEFFDKKNQQILKDQLAARKKGKEDPYEIEWTRKDGKKVTTIISPKAVFNTKGKQEGSFAVITDISDIKKYEEKLKALNKDLTIRESELLRSNRDLEQFAYVASHDLQEPLRAVSSFSQLLSQRYSDKLDTDAKEFIGFVVGGSLRMQQLINDLLAFSRVSTLGKPFEPTDCNSILGQAIANLSTMIEENRAIITNDELPTINVDASQLVLVFQNLIGNAMKFKGEDLPCVHISAHEKDSDWVFAVKDNGIGIEPQYFDKIFVIFQRLHGKDEYHGTGIGLSICKKIIERHSGNIWVESEPGKGSTFYFTIPK